MANFFITVVFNKEQLENAKFQLTSSQQQYERTKVQVEVGALPKSNELNLDAQVATNELNVITRENTLTLSLLQLKQALQLPASTPLDVVVPELEVEDLVLDQDRDQIYEIARNTMPEIKSAAIRIESANYGVKAARGNLYPRLSLSGSINSNYSSASDRARFIPDGGTLQWLTIPQIGSCRRTAEVLRFIPRNQCMDHPVQRSMDMAEEISSGQYLQTGFIRSLDTHI